MTDHHIPRSVYARCIIIDTGVIKALIDDRDGRHGEAQFYYEQIRSRDFEILITNTTIYECYTRIMYDLGFQKAIDFLQNTSDWIDRIIRVTEEDDKDSIDHLLRFDEDLSYVDALNFSVMLRLGINKAFSFDRHFTFPGFEVIPINYFLT